MTQADTNKNFFRQSGWMMASNLACGVFMAGANFASANITPLTDYSIFITILRIFVLVTLPAAGIQTLLAQQTAAAVTDQSKRDLAATARGLLAFTLIFWVILVVGAAIFRQQIANVLQASSPNIIWAILALILAGYLFPLFLGLMQGVQNFLVFGWATILNGVGRFAAIAVGIKALNIQATGATLGACGGFVAGVLTALWPSRIIFRGAGGHFDKAAFFKKVFLLTAGAGSTLFIMNVAMPLIQSHFDKQFSQVYGGAETIGFAIVILCVPVAAVMFPKIVRSRATASSSNALYLAVVGTAIIGGLSAIFCSLFPQLPLRILFPKRPDMIAAAPLIPWLMWAMVPLTMYNVLVNNLIARERYGIVPFAAILPIVYSVTLYFFLERNTLPPMDAFKRVVQILMAFSSALLAASVYFSLRASAADAAASRSPATAARP
jgi:O-antigen/teichoic acid export membrane protein